MGRLSVLVCCLVAVTMALIAVHAQSRGSSVAFVGARLIIGDVHPPIENGAFVVQDGHISAIGSKGTVAIPPRATQIDLTGKTVMPALINIHAHLGWELFTPYGDVPAAADNFTAENVVDHLQRHAFYGVGTVNDAGSAVIPVMLPFLADQAVGKFPTAARMTLMAGIVPPNGGPDGILIKGTRPRHANYEVLRAPEARKAVQEIANLNIKQIKIWIDDRGGSYPMLPHEVFDAVVDEAHKHGIKVHAHALMLWQWKEALKAGVDVIVHTVGTFYTRTSDNNIDNELIALVKQKKPYWTPVMGLGDHSEVCDNDPFVDQAFPDKVIADIRASNACKGSGAPPVGAEREALLKSKSSFMTLINAGARPVLGTDTGVSPRYSFGFADHHEMGMYAFLGLSPAEVIVASTSRPAELLGLKDVGTLAEGKIADFIVLNANPLDDIKNTRQISAVYLRGAKLDRKTMLSQWKKTTILSH